MTNPTMTESDFKGLCRATSIALQAEDPEEFAQRGAICIDNIDIALHLSKEPRNNDITCYLDVGPIEHERTDEIMRELLQLNLRTGIHTDGVYAIDPVNNSALFIVHLSDAKNLIGASLADALLLFAGQAKYAREEILKCFN